MDSDEDSFEIDNVDSGNVSSGDEGDDDFPMDDIPSVQERQADNDEYIYEVLTTDEIVLHQREIIDEVKGVLKLPPTITRMLLNHFKWDKERLLEKYFDGNAEDLFKGAHIVNPFNKPVTTNKQKNAKNTAEECEICFSQLPSDSMAGLECGDRFCLTCWREYLTTKIVTEGLGQSISCAAHGCDILVDDVTVTKLVTDARVRVKYQQLITNSFVECNQLLRWCPSIDCTYAIKVAYYESRPVRCKCGHEFCFACGENWHDPVKCRWLKKWIKKCDDDSETSNWIAANTKECPKCNVTIEKDGGCNHMVCKNQNCKHDFCWVCLGSWEPHGSSWYNCNRYDEDEAKAARHAQEKFRSSLARYLHYYNRYMNHMQSLKFENKLYASVKHKMEEMQQHNMSWIEVQFLKKAVDILCQCRQTLMYTYVFAYYLKKNNQSMIFEDNQKDLESATEKLSEYLERDITSENLADIKQKVQDKYRFKTSFPSRMKMEKTPRYTQRERNMVLGYAAQYKEIIENKRTDAESNRKKDEVWRQIAKEFNVRVYHQRSSKQLRQLYKNMKLLLKKDLCGEGKGNRTFMDLLNTISQQESVAQYISEQMSPNGYSGRQKYEDDYDDSKFPLLQHPVLNYDGMDHDVIVIKSEDISDNDQSRSGEAMDEDDDDDCLSTKDIPEVCLEEEDEELFATDLRQQQQTPNVQQQTQTQMQKSNPNQSLLPQNQQQSQQNQQQSPLLHHSQQPEITIQNIGGIRVGSIGSMANMKALQNAINNNSNNNNNSNSSSNTSNNNNSATPTNSALSITHANGAAAGQALNLRQASAEQQLLLNGLGLSAVNHNNNNVMANNPRMPALQRASQHQQQQHQHQHQQQSNNNQLQPPHTHNNLHLNSHSHSHATQQLLLNINSGSPFIPHNKHYGHPRQTSTPNHSSHKNSQNDYFMLGIEERKLKIELLNAQIDYWKKLTKKLDESPGHNPNPSCMCHFPGKSNGAQTPSSTS